MPAIDTCEPQVIRALEKEGWVVTDKPFTILAKDSYVFADLRLQRDTTKRVVIEVKCFPATRSIRDEFYHAVGQYLYYRTAIQSLKLQIPLVLAVPEVIYWEFLQKPIPQTLLNHAKINYVRIVIDTEEVIAWQMW